MKQLSLLALQADKDNIYDSLIRSKSVQIKRCVDIVGGSTVDTSLQVSQLQQRIDRAENAISVVLSKAEQYNSTHKGDDVSLPKGSFARPLQEVKFDDYLAFGNNVDEVENGLDELDTALNNLSALQQDRASAQSNLANVTEYASLPHPTTWYKDTQTTIIRLCQLPSSELNGLETLAQEYQTVTLEVVSQSASTALVVVVAHKSESDFCERAVAYGLVRCGFVCDKLPTAIIAELKNKIVGLDSQIQQADSKIASFASSVLRWQIYVDYLGLCMHKLVADGNLQTTTSTFVLQAYYPAEQEQVVIDALQSACNAVVYYFKDIGEEEFAPTLTRNNKLVKPFETVTNNYTPPDYHEIDPTPTMSLFYFVLFGFMVADIGYGLLLLFVGLFATFAIKQPSGTKTLAQMFGLCGFSAIAVGLLYGGFFSYQIYPNGAPIPDPSEQPMITMFISLILGIVHISAGIACNMAVKFKHKQKLSAWLTDFPWIIVFASFVLTVLNPMLDMAGYQPYIDKLYLPSAVGNVALYVCLGSLAFAIIFAGLGTKGLFGKLAKSFGSAYGIINYFSDIMSYIRVFGLMLSSALMGQVINQLGAMVMGDGGVGYLLAGIVLVFAHLFNLVMGLLSVYIHNGRLQYVEFFGKFYTGDGQLFVPFGSQTKYLLLK